MGNENLNAASKAKQDEFYTQMTDIANECWHYKEHFRGKSILCNCDDPYESEFFKYFAMSFNHLELKKLIASCYIGSPIANTELSMFDDESAENKTTKHPHKIEITAVTDGAVDLADVELLLRNRKNGLTRLQGDGDFRSPECIAMLKEADVIVTNPPFSLFREYVAQLAEYEKKFLVIGSMNAITYKEIFKLIKENKLWLGFHNGPKTYVVPSTYTQKNIEIKNSVAYAAMGNTCWFTNLDIKKRHEELILWKKYTPEDFPKYDNYDAIEVGKVVEIPCDYNGVMGVPVTFLDKHNPDQFEILGNLGCYAPDGYSLVSAIYVNGKKIFKRIAIKRKELKA